MTAAEKRTTQRWLISVSVRELPLSVDLGRVSRWRVGAKDKITNDIYGRA